MFAEQCEMIDCCGFFLHYKQHSEVVKQGWINAFCGNKLKSKHCKRKQIKLATGQVPADNMTPTGRIIG